MGMFTPAEASLIDRIPYWGFVAKDVVLTKSGQFLFFYRVRTAGVDGRAAEHLDVVNRAWQKMLGAIEAPDRAFVVYMRPEQPLPTDFDNFTDIAALAQRKRLAYVAGRVRRMERPFSASRSIPASAGRSMKTPVACGGSRTSGTGWSSACAPSISPSW